MPEIQPGHAHRTSDGSLVFTYDFRDIEEGRVAFCMESHDEEDDHA